MTALSGHRGPVWLASYMKSGNTWMRLMLMHILKPVDERWTIDQEIPIGKGPLPRSSIERSSYIDTSLLSAQEQDLLRPRLCDFEALSDPERCFFKSHDAYRFNVAGIPIHGKSAGQAALYLVRDPRDVVASLSDFWGWSPDATIRFLNSPESDLHGTPRRFSQQIFQKTLDWSSHVASWVEQDRVRMLLIRYEDLQAAPAFWLGRALDFLGISATTADIERAVELTRFETLRRQEQAHGFPERFRPDTPFFRAGKSGAGREMLGPERVALIERMHGPMMQRLGYLDTAVETHK